MTPQIIFDGKKFLTSREASRVSGYASDYIGQLCRGGKLSCRRVGKSWFVEEDSLIAYTALDLNHSPEKGERLNGGKSRTSEVAETPDESVTMLITALAISSLVPKSGIVLP